MSFSSRSGRRPYPSDISDDEWAFLAPYLCLMKLTAPQRTYDLRDVFNALRWMIRSGAPWRFMPQHFLPWDVVYKRTQRWITAGVFEQVVHDLREMLRLREGHSAQPTAAIIDGRTMRSSRESSPRAG